MVPFCFVIHPLSFDDVVRYEPGAAGKGRPIIAKILEWMPAYAAAHITGVRTPDGRETEGWFVAAPLLPSQMLALPREEVYRRIHAAIAIGAELGARIAGLGAFTAVIGDGGVTVAERAPIPVTTGNSLTVAAGVRSLLRGAAEMGVAAETATAVVVGATGSIGAACAQLLAPRVGRVIMVARNATRLRAFHERVGGTLPCPSRATVDLRAAVREADLVLTATSSTRELIEPEDLRPGAVVCELSLPHDVSRRIAVERPDVLVMEGGNLRVPGAFRAERVREPGTEFDLGLPPGTALACMSETMLLALEGRCESYSLGRGLSLERVREIDALAERAGFALADMRAFDKAITREQIRAARAAAAERRQILRVKHVVSVSLGSVSRDHRAHVRLLGEEFTIVREGTDGSLDRASARIAELDGTVDAIGLGGIDVYLYAGHERYALRDGLRLLAAAKTTPVVDGSGLKNTLERSAVRYLVEELGIALHGRRVLMVSALDRFGMAQALVAAGADVIFGDFIFALDLDRPVRGLDEFEEMARKYLPDACKLPFQFFYPTGKKQDRPPQPKYPEYYDDADVIAGDFHFMRQYMPERLDGKVVLTNTLTQRDVEDLRARGVATLISTTPEFEGRSFGTNVVEAALLALLGKRWAEVTADDYARVIDALQLRPRLLTL